MCYYDDEYFVIMNIDHILDRLGFSKNEIKTYLAALELSTAAAQDIAKEASLPRTTVYSVLTVLVRRGVVAKTLANGRTRFIAEPPQRLLSILDDLHTDLKAAMPEFAARYNNKGSKPRIVFYEGKIAIQKVFDDILETRPAELLEWNTDEFFEHDKYRTDRLFIDKRVKLGIHAKRIGAVKSRWQTEHQRFDKWELSETAIVPREVFSPDIEVNIYDNKVAFMNYVENMALIIESKPIADAMRQAYALSWKGAKSIEVAS